jgi:2-polyprenyl-3-methyl-5-hydroxy-6-metoxy-1,4-benzoquinol methylase
VKTIKFCPVCGSSDAELAYSAPTTRGQDRKLWIVFECRDCGHQYLNPQPTWEELEPYYNSGYDPYDPMHDSEADDDQEIEKAQKLRLFRHIPLPTEKRLLDVGCGAGRFLRLAKKLGAFEQGVEPNEYAASVAQKQGLNVFHGTLEEFARGVGSIAKFDVITANHVVEHVPDPVATLRAMKQLLAPHGFIWIAVPNAAYPVGRALRGRWHSADLPYHLMQFTPRSMIRAGERAGLVLRHQETESIPRIVESSLGQYFRYKWMLPRRLTQPTGINRLFSHWFAKRMDARVNGEAILSEFVQKNGNDPS